MEEFNCPCCNKDILIANEFYDGKTVCPECSAKIKVGFDYTLGGDYEEHPVYELLPMSDEDYEKEEDYFESKKIAKTPLLRGFYL